MYHLLLGTGLCLLFIVLHEVEGIRVTIFGRQALAYLGFVGNDLYDLSVVHHLWGMALWRCMMFVLEHSVAGFALWSNCSYCMDYCLAGGIFLTLRSPIRPCVSLTLIGTGVFRVDGGLYLHL